MVVVLGWVLVLVLVLALLHSHKYLGHALHELGLHNHHLLHCHLRWWVREVVVVVGGVASVAGVAGIGVTIVGVACSTPGVGHLK